MTEGDNAEPGTAEELWAAEMTGAAPGPDEAFLVDVAGFEGPLDLLLALVEQYLLFIGEAEKIRLELAADYLVMAAWLAFLKSRLLLPREEVPEDQPSGEELAARLAFRLMRLEAMRNAAAQLMTRKRLGRDVFGRGMPEGTKTIRDREYSAEIFDLLRAYAEQRKRTTVRRSLMVRQRVVWSIKDARQRLETLVGHSTGDWVQLDLFLEQYLIGPELGRTALASSFGATLEMAREGVIELRQEEAFAPIYMRRRGGEWERVT
jgi:segregation and condensation protein A